LAGGWGAQMEAMASSGSRNRTCGRWYERLLGSVLDPSGVGGAFEVVIPVPFVTPAALPEQP